MSEPTSPKAPRSTSTTSVKSREKHRSDRAISVPLIRLFYPDPDPTESFPGESAEIEGYIVAPDHTFTIAATTATSEGVDMLDAVWLALRRKGVGRRRMILLDDRGRTVSVMTLHADLRNDLVRALRNFLVVPIRARGGFAEVHFYATTDELGAIERKLEADGEALPPIPAATLPPVKETGALQAEDWAFLGLLNCVGAFDGPEGPTPQLVAELLGLDPDALAEQASEIERGLGSLVSDLFATKAGAAPATGSPGT